MLMFYFLAVRGVIYFQRAADWQTGGAPLLSPSNYTTRQHNTQQAIYSSLQSLAML